MVAASGKRARFIAAPCFGGVVDKLRSVIAVELHGGQRDGRLDICQSLERPLVSVIEEGTQLNPAGSDVGGGQRMHILA